MTTSARHRPAPRATLVFVHGPCLGPWTWHEHLVPHFEALGLRCFAPDLHEAWPEPAWSARVARLPLARYVERLHGVLARLRGPTILVGHSLGARVVEGLVARGHTDGAVLVAPTPPQGLEAEARRIAARHPLPFARALVARRPLLMLGEPGRPDPARVRELLLGPRASAALVVRTAGALRDEPFVACLDWLRARPPAPRAAPVPVLVVAGRDDPLVTPTALRRAAAAWGATARVVPHAGHCPMLGDAAPVLARHIERWLFED
jgi:pimeloyl-ACP methyl ester carboxylesterase